MASARLIPKKIYHSKSFLKLPVTAQNLYTFLLLNSDNDGIVEAYAVMSMIKAADDDLRVLEERGFVFVLDEEWVSYIRGFQDFNKLDARNFQVSKHRELLVTIHPEIQDKLVIPTRRERKNDESHGNTGDDMESPGEGKTNEKKGTSSIDDDIAFIIDFYNDLKIYKERKSEKLKTKIKKSLTQITLQEAKNIIEYASLKYHTGQYTQGFVPRLGWLLGEGLCETQNKMKKQKQQFNGFSNQNDYDFDKLEKELLEN